MTIHFGKNLKKLRKEKDLTQENLADFLGVTFQAVSKWERGETYPDITMLPVISSFFGVSIDDLIGVDKTRNEQKINGYLSLYDEMRLKDTSLVFTEFQKAVKEFPGEYSVLIRYMDLLRDEKDNTLLPDYEKTSQELMSIYKNIQSHCTDDSIRIWSKRLISTHLIKKYECTCNEEGTYRVHKEFFEQAKNIINELPSISDSRENLSIMLCDRSNWYETYRASIQEFYYHLQMLIIGYCYYSDNFTPEYKIEMINHLNGILKLICNDGNYDKNQMHLIYNYGHLGHLYFEIGDTENALKHLRIAAEHAAELDKHPNVYEKISRFYETEKAFHDMTMCTRMTLLMKKHYPLSDEFRAMPEFKEITELLGNIDIDGIIL